MTEHTIVCPQCQHAIPLSDALTHQVEERLRSLKQEQDQEFRQKQETLVAREQALMVAHQQQETVIAQRIEAEKKIMWAKAQEKAHEKLREEFSQEKKLMEEQNREKDTELKRMREQELSLRKLQYALEQKAAAMELENARTLDVERQKIAAEVGRKVSEDYRLKEAEKEKTIRDMRDTIEELQRKAQQGSQQTQGEVLELELEEFLRNNFPYDVIEPVPKGIQGADVLHYIHTKTGSLAGTLVWEFKRTKSWSDGWVTKLKEDQRTCKAELAIVVSRVLPKDIVGFGYYNGIWVCDASSVLGLATALRMHIVQVAAAKRSAAGKEGKMEHLYTYMTSTEFRHRVQAMVEGFMEMQQDLEKERRIAERQWAKREKQIQKVISNTSGFYGDLQGVLGSTLHTIPALDAGDEHDE